MTATAAARWVESGAASLTGLPDGPGLVPPAAVLAQLERIGAAAETDVWSAVTERAAVAGLSRQGATSCGGAARLLRAADGWLAVTLAREDDRASVPAWLGLGDPPGDDPWPAVASALEAMPAAEAEERGVLLGLPLAVLPSSPPPTPLDQQRLPVRWTELGSGRAAPRRRPVVVDLSSLWAGPLCARTLGAAGADVVKVESLARPDGARRGPSLFFDRLHAGHRSVALDLAAEGSRQRLVGLVATADVVIEASRPRALAQLGVRPQDFGADGPRVWVSLTGHGRGAGAQRVGFGDDTAVAGGLVAPGPTGPLFVADAVADPLSGLVAAAAAHAALERGGRWLLDVALRSVSAWVAGSAAGAWATVVDPPPPSPVAPPEQPAPELGADTDTVLARLA